MGVIILQYNKISYSKLEFPLLLTYFQNPNFDHWKNFLELVLALPQELIESFLDVDYIASTILQCNWGCSIPKGNLVPNVPIFRQSYDIHQQCLWSLLPEQLQFVRIVMSDGFEFVIRRSV